MYINFICLITVSAEHFLSWEQEIWVRYKMYDAIPTIFSAGLYSISKLPTENNEYRIIHFHANNRSVETVFTHKNVYVDTTENCSNDCNDGLFDNIQH